MKILQSVQKYYAKHGLTAPDLFQKHPWNSKNLQTLIAFGHFCASSFAFIFLEAETFGEYAQSYFITSGMIVAAVYFIIFVSKSEKLFRLIRNIEISIHKRFENERSKTEYENVNAQVNKFTLNSNFVFLKLSWPCTLMPNFIMSFYLYFTTDAGSDVFKLPFPQWMPFDCTNPLGYSIAFAIQGVEVYIANSVVACSASLFMGLYSMLLTYARDIKEEIYTLQIGETAKSFEVKQKLIEFVEIHANAKQLVRDFVDIFEYIILSIFMWSLSTICCSLLMLQIELQKSANPLTLLSPLCLAFWSFAASFIFCHFGENITGQFNELNDAVFQCEWYNFSVEVQRLIPTVLIATQHPAVLKSFGNVVCTRETFKKVANSGFSYFTMLRQFGK